MTKKKKELTLISALEHIYLKSKNCKMEEEYFEKNAEEFAYLRHELGLTDMQLLFMAVVANKGEADNVTISNHLGITNLRFMIMKSAIDGLRKKLWIISNNKKYYLSEGVLESLADNKTFTPKIYSNLSEHTFLTSLDLFYRKYRWQFIDFATLIGAWMNLLENNKDLPICRKILELQTNEEQIIFLFFGSRLPSF